MNIIEEVKKLNLPFGEYVVIGSGTLQALGIRDAQDIDISVTERLHVMLRRDGGWVEEERYGRIFLKSKNIEINPQLQWDGYATTTKQAIATALLIDGVPFLNLEELKNFKRALGREKDMQDIDLIDQYLSKIERHGGAC